MDAHAQAGGGGDTPSAAAVPQAATAGSGGAPRKKRKWDVPGPSSTQVAQLTAAVQPPTPLGLAAAIKPGQPLDADAIRRAQQAAAAVANKLSMESVAKGALVASKAFTTQDLKAEIFREVTFNDAPSQIRFHLTKRTVQDDIQRRTKTVIVTRGRYYPPGAKVEDSERPLHLRITPGAGSGQTDESRGRAVDAAMTEIQRIMQGEATLNESFAAPLPAPVETAVYAGFEAPPEFGLGNRLRGAGGSYLHHIASQSRTSIVLRGRGSFTAEGPEPLHIYITAPHAKALEEARSLTNDLIATVRREFESKYGAAAYHHSSLYPPLPPVAAAHFSGTIPGIPGPPAGAPPPLRPSPYQMPYASAPAQLPSTSVPSYSSAGFQMPQVTYGYNTPAPPPHTFGRSFPAPLSQSMAMGIQRPEAGLTQSTHAVDANAVPSQSYFASSSQPSQSLTSSGYSQNIYSSINQSPVARIHRQSGEATNMSVLTPPEQHFAQKQRTSPKRKFREVKEGSPPLEAKAASQGLPSLGDLSSKSNSASLYSKQYAAPLVKVPMGPPPPRLKTASEKSPSMTSSEKPVGVAQGSVTANAGLTGVLSGLVADYDGED